MGGVGSGGSRYRPNLGRSGMRKPKRSGRFRCTTGPTTTMFVRIGVQELAQLKAQAAAEGLMMSVVVRGLVKDYLEETCE